MDQSIRGLDDLKKSTEPIAITCPSGAPPPEDFNFITRYLADNYYDLFQRAKCYDSRAEMAEGVRAKEAIAAFDDAGMLDYIAKRSKCELQTAGSLFGLQEYGYVFPKNSKLRDPFNSAIAKTRASRWTVELEEKYFTGNPHGCDASDVKTERIDE